LRAEREKNSSNETLIRLPTDERALISASDLPYVGERKKLSHPPTAAAAPPPAPARSSPVPLRSARAEALPPAPRAPRPCRQAPRAPRPCRQGAGFAARFGGKIPAAPPPPPLVAVGGLVMRACCWFRLASSLLWFPSPDEILLSLLWRTDGDVPLGQLRSVECFSGLPGFDPSSASMSRPRMYICAVPDARPLHASSEGYCTALVFCCADCRSASLV